MRRSEGRVSEIGIKLALGFVFVSPALWSAPPESNLEARYGRLSLNFEENQGQTDAQVRFLSRGSGYSLFLTDSEAVLALSGGGTLRMQFHGASRHPRVSGSDQLPGKANYFVGNNPAKWHSDVPTFGKVEYHSVYPGVDLVYYGNQQQLEYDFIIAPSVNPNEIELQFPGAVLNLTSDGDLIVRVRGEDVTFHKPTAYQWSAGQKEIVPGRFRRLAKNAIGFSIGNYDKAKPLIIDPSLAYSTFLRGAGDNRAYAIAVDPSGEAYVTGETGSQTFPVTGGTFQPTAQPGGDAFVAKINASGSALLYSTYLGDNETSGLAIAVDSGGNAYVAGLTGSTTFPVTPGAFQTSPSASTNGTPFITKLNPTGSRLVYSTYFAAVASIAAIAVDAAGNAHLTGAAAYGLPTTPGAFQIVPPSPYLPNAFITKLNSLGTALLYSTYLGSTTDDSTETAATTIALDPGGDAYIGGYTDSGNFPVTAGAFQGNFQGTVEFGAINGFVTEMNPTGTSLKYSTYLSGSGSVGFAGQNGGTVDGIAVDATGAAYVTGFTQATDFPTTRGAFQTQCLISCNDAFVAKLNPAGSALVYSTYLHGQPVTMGNTEVFGEVTGVGIAVDSSGSAIVTGLTSAPAFPVTSDAFQSAKNGPATSFNCFLSKLTPSGSSLVYSTYFGGSSTNGETCRGVSLDSAGNAYIGGYTFSDDFPTTRGAFQTAYLTGPDAFVAEFGVGSETSDVTIQFNTSPAGLAYSFDGAVYSTPQTLSVAAGSTHTISVTSPQITGGTQNTFANWSDGGAQTHVITAASSATYTAAFNTAYLLTTGATPPGGGTVSPASGNYYAAGTVVPLAATANSGYAFNSWTGGVANAASATTSVVMSAPQTVTASFAPFGVAALFGNITGKSGQSSARVWSIQVSNSGPASAFGAQVSGISLVQVGGASCSPVLTSQLPAAAGNLAAGASATVPVALDFSSCAANARFTVTIGLSANSASATGSILRLNQFQ